MFLLRPGPAFSWQLTEKLPKYPEQQNRHSPGSALCRSSSPVHFVWLCSTYSKYKGVYDLSLISDAGPSEFFFEKNKQTKKTQNQTNKQNPLQNHHSLHSEKVLQTIHIWLCLLNLAKSIDLGLRSLLAAQSWVGCIPWPMLNRMKTEWNLALQI